MSPRQSAAGIFSGNGCGHATEKSLPLVSAWMQALLFFSLYVGYENSSHMLPAVQTQENILNGVAVCGPAESKGRAKKEKMIKVTDSQMFDSGNMVTTQKCCSWERFLRKALC